MAEHLDTHLLSRYDFILFYFIYCFSCAYPAYIVTISVILDNITVQVDRDHVKHPERILTVGMPYRLWTGIRGTRPVFRPL